MGAPEKGIRILGKKNLRNRINTAIMNSFHEGVSKRSVKREGVDTEGRIYSYATRGALLDLSKNFCHWIKDTHPGVKHPAGLNAELIYEFLSEKRKNGATQKTLDAYRTNLKIIGAILRKYYPECEDVDLSVGRVYADVDPLKTRGAKSVISEEDFKKLFEYATKHPSGSGYAVILERRLGVRVSDLAYGINIDWDEKVLHINCKGGKILDRPIDDLLANVLRWGEKKGYVVGSKIRLPKDESINRWLARTEAALGLEAHSMHDLRRFCAQEHYDELRKEGKTREEALQLTSVWLNHGPNRIKMMLESYIGNPW